ncbi:hypothetical protein LPTSP3_g11190 [Leptospira kobayashii]|uniref:Ferrochelatase n=1 Tax=Leptospira kobayashii TaxID=1917830 RepID=A0ABN6KD08_9LEPT|nr:ferrochelatase [Leptospira kobayashii]BDA78189.1 hypothetical protein LPTSP3_g11190 [Leptospira kobayashii]
MKRKITLLNLGGPRTALEIETFLRDLFLDPYVFDLPLWEPLRQILAKYIAKKRAPKVRSTYESMGFGGGSPLVDETIKQTTAVVKVLNEKTSDEWFGQVAMACGYPNLKDILKKEDGPGPNHIWVPLFPQYSRSTVLSVAKIAESIIGKYPLDGNGWLQPFGLDTRFLDVSASLILDYFQGKLSENHFLHPDNTKGIEDWKTIDLVFSAHGIPMRLIRKGDTYVNEIETSVSEITKRLREKGFSGEVHLSYQSRVGPAKWTEPNTKTTLHELGRSGKRIAVYPISFVSDHLETLEEIGVELRDLALESGASSYHRIPSFGTYPLFIDLLSDLILESV